MGRVVFNKNNFLRFLSFTLLTLLVFAQIRVAVFADSNTWDFSTDTEYNYDNSKVEFTSGQAKLKPSATSPTWYNNSWGYRKLITIDHTKVSGTQTSFPVLISSTSTDWKDVANGGFVGKSNGYDILFTADDGTTKLNHEIEKYVNTTGELVAWVNVPSLSSVIDTTLYIYYGNSQASDQQNTTSVWDSNYKMVQHAKGSGQMNDSTSFGNSGTITGDPFESYSISSVSPHTTSHQGVATDGTNYYTFDTDAITKWDASWVQTNQLLNANQSIGVNTTNHLSDGEYYNGKLYVPVENYVHKCVSSTNNYLAIWNASDLSFDTKIDISGLGFSSAGLTIDPNAGDNGIIYNISYCDGTKIWKLDLATGAYLGAINLSQTISDSQGITMKDGYFYITDDLNDVVWKVDQNGTVLHSVLSYPHVASGSLEGLDYNTNNLLVLVDQGVSDRKVYTFEHTGPSKIGTALDFKKSESISIPYQLPDSGTVSLWYNPKNYFYNFHSLLDNSVSDNDWELWVDSTGYVNFRVKNGEVAVKYDLGDNATKVGLDTWFNIVIKWQKGGSKYLLVNGVQRGSNSISSTWVDPGSSTYIGGGNPGNTKDNGYFDEIRFSDVVRSNNWLLTEYNNQSSPSTFYTIGSQSGLSYDTSNPSVETISPFSFSSAMSNFVESATKNVGEVKYQISNDSGATWYWYNSGWTTTSSGYSEATTASIINSNISTFPVGSGQFVFKAYLHSDGTQLVKIDSVNVTYQNAHSITASAGLNGSISPNGAKLVNNGDSQTYSITPNSGYKIAGVVVDGLPVGAVSSYTFNNVVTGHTISASFELLPVDPAPENGSEDQNPQQSPSSTNPMIASVITISQPSSSDSVNQPVVSEDNSITKINSIINKKITMTASGDCSKITSLDFISPSVLDKQDDNRFKYEQGMASFKLKCKKAGQEAQVKFILDKQYDTSNWTYRKYLNSSQQYVDFSSSIDYGLEYVNGESRTTVSFSIKDGSEYDGDGLSDGVITDPVGPAITDANYNQDTNLNTEKPVNTQQEKTTSTKNNSTLKTLAVLLAIFVVIYAIAKSKKSKSTKKN